MQDSPFSQKTVWLSILVSSIIVAAIFLSHFFDDKTKIVFCDVGQGDGAYIRIKNKVDILVDAGPDNKIMACLGKNMPFYDHKIEIAILTHPQKDHYGGFIKVLEHYSITTFLTSDLNNQSQSFQALITGLKNQQTKINFPKAGNTINVAGDRLIFLWPHKRDLTLSDDDNYRSIVFSLEENQSRVIFTGDANQAVLSHLVIRSVKNSTILKVPHHGSNNGLTLKFLELAQPTMSVISVGKNNGYGHPTKKILTMFKALKIPYLRTDEIGDVIIKLQ